MGREDQEVKEPLIAHEDRNPAECIDQSDEVGQPAGRRLQYCWQLFPHCLGTFQYFAGENLRFRTLAVFHRARR